jgi:serine/threonine protein kinase
MADERTESSGSPQAPKAGEPAHTRPASTAAVGEDARPAAGREVGTEVAPGHRPLLPTTKLEPRSFAAMLPEPGQRFDDFELLRLLGEGAFAKVFLARQVSLDRHVALKVSANRGCEARTLASLEHDHIVQVFLEVVDRPRDLRLLCMQYVPGTTLERVIRQLARQDHSTWSGRAILEAIDKLSAHPAAFDPAALRDREWLQECDFIEAACWIGARLADALAYAHRQGVLHRDIKPANILMNPYGRPLLADFNIARDPHRDREAAGEIFGGTLAYMGPEHVDAFNRQDPTPREAVDERSDVYSLGVVMFELLTGRQPFADVPLTPSLGDALRRMATQRRAAAPSPRRRAPDVPETLDRVIRRCLDPEPRCRYQTAAELGQALEGCGALRHIDQELPAPGPLTRAAQRRPFFWLVVLALWPHLLGSLVNISYNRIQIVGDLTPAQQATFLQLVLGYNLVVYPTCLWILFRRVLPGFRAWRQLAGTGTEDEDQVARVRRQVLSWPRWVAGVSCLGWLPGGLLFPLGIHLATGPVGVGVFVHFLVSFAISGLIAVTYSYFGVQFIVLRVLYPRLWVDARDLPRHVAEELGAGGPRSWLFQLLAGAIPLAAAVLMVVGGPEEAGDRTFRLLVTALILLGMAGFGLALLANHFLGQTRDVLLSALPRPRSPRSSIRQMQQE